MDASCQSSSLLLVARSRSCDKSMGKKKCQLESGRCRIVKIFYGCTWRDCFSPFTSTLLRLTVFFLTSPARASQKSTALLCCFCRTLSALKCVVGFCRKFSLPPKSFDSETVDFNENRLHVSETRPCTSDYAALHAMPSALWLQTIGA